MTQIINLKDVTLRKNDKVILDGVNWQVNKGEHWAVLGLNGSGKTSLLNIIMGYLFRTKGEVSVLGNLFGRTNLPELRKKIGFVSSSLDQFSQTMAQESVEAVVASGKFASMGIYENVSEADWERADALLKNLRLDYLKGKSFYLLSQGEKRRVLIARALMSQPKILILDEPCSGLDILSREEVLSITKDIVANNCHIIYVTHHIEELVEEMTHVLLLHKGKVVAAGPKKEIVKADLLSQAFETPVNVRWEDSRPWLTVKKETVGQKI